MSRKYLTDAEREFEARKFFWSIMDRSDCVVTPEEAHRAIQKLAEAIPPFTRLAKARSAEFGNIGADGVQS